MLTSVAEFYEEEKHVNLNFPPCVADRTGNPYFLGILVHIMISALFADLFVFNHRAAATRNYGTTQDDRPSQPQDTFT